MSGGGQADLPIQTGLSGHALLILSEQAQAWPCGEGWDAEEQVETLYVSIGPGSEQTCGHIRPTPSDKASYIVEVRVPG